MKTKQFYTNDAIVVDGLADVRVEGLLQLEILDDRLYDHVARRERAAVGRRGAAAREVGNGHGCQGE